MKDIPKSESGPGPEMALLQSEEALAQMLREQGEDQQSIEALAPVLRRLPEWRAPTLEREDTQRLLASLLPMLPGWASRTVTDSTKSTVTQTDSSIPQPALVERSSLRQALRQRFAQPRSRLGWILDVALLQGMLVRPSFWLASAFISALGLLAVVFSIPGNDTLVLRVLGPFLAALAVVAAFRSARLNMLEIELSCPASPLRLTIARLVLVLGYDVLLGLAMSVALALVHRQDGQAGNPGLLAPMLMTVGYWLAPLLLVAGLSLLLSLRMPMERAAALAYTGWLVLLVPLLAESAGNAEHVGQTPGFLVSILSRGEAALAMAVVGILLMVAALSRMRASLSVLLPYG